MLGVSKITYNSDLLLSSSCLGRTGNPFYYEKDQNLRRSLTMFDQSRKQLTVGSSVNLNMIHSTLQLSGILIFHNFQKWKANSECPEDKFSFGSESVMRHRYSLTRQSNTVRKTHKHDQVPKPKNACPYIKYFTKTYTGRLPLKPNPKSSYSPHP